MRDHERLSRLPDPELAWLDDLLDPCQPLPESKPSALVRRIQRGQAAEIAAAAEYGRPGSDTRGTPVEAVSEPAGPVCSLSPKWGAA